MAKKVITVVYEFLTRRSVVIALSSIVLLAFVLRTVLPLQTVFGQGYINFLEGDAYSRMWYATKIQAMPFSVGLTFAVENGLFFPWLVAMLGNIMPIELVGAWLPPILAVGVVVLVYFIGATVFNKTVGIMASLFVAIIPSEFYHRTLLGFADHHAMEVFLMALIVFLVVKSIRSEKYPYVFGMGAGVALLLYLGNWTGGLLLVGILGLVMLVYLGQRIFNKLSCKKELLSLLITLGVGVGFYVFLGGFNRFFFWLPIQEVGNASVQHASGVANEMITTILTPVSQRTTSELMPLLMPFGKFDLGVVITNLHFFVITFIAGLVFIFYWRKDKANLFILLWSLVLFVITLNERRFLYYFTLPVGLLSAWGIYELGQWQKKHQYALMISVSTVLVVVSLPVLQLIGATNVYAMPPEWHDALEWLDEQPDDGMVTAWSDYGHWIQYTADKPASYLPGPGGDKVAKIFLSVDDAEVQLLLEELNAGYLIVDRVTMEYKTIALEIVSGYEYSEYSVGVQLLNGIDKSYLDLLYSTENINIYRYQQK